eukprot:scaffold29016_cov43-Cyclotella_meneghiniana.AAC.6
MNQRLLRATIHEGSRHEVGFLVSNLFCDNESTGYRVKMDASVESAVVAVRLEWTDFRSERADSRSQDISTPSTSQIIQKLLWRQELQTQLRDQEVLPLLSLEGALPLPHYKNHRQLDQRSLTRRLEGRLPD